MATRKNSDIYAEAKRLYRTEGHEGWSYSQIALKIAHDGQGNLPGKIGYAHPEGLIRPSFITAYSGVLDNDIIVTGSLYPSLTLYGWLPRRDVEAAPVHWKTLNGERIEYGHRLHKDAFFPFDYAMNCDHSAGIWSFEHSAWRCLGCDRLRYCRADELMIERIDGYGISTRGDHPT